MYFIMDMYTIQLYVKFNVWMLSLLAVIQSINNLLASDLPPGVTPRDVELFKETREKANSVSWYE